LDTSNCKIQRKAQTNLGRQYNTGHPPTEYQKLDSLCSRPSEMEKHHWEGQNFQQIRKSSAWWRRRYLRLPIFVQCVSLGVLTKEIQLKYRTRIKKIMSNCENSKWALWDHARIWHLGWVMFGYLKMITNGKLVRNSVVAIMV
jgi:hypothetical protein